jgi:dTDP-4-amino-4,6-dideoxygalactose transaminase
MKIKVPLVDLVAQYHSIRKEIDKSIARVIQKGRFIGGEEVRKFAIEFANVANTPYCIPCANGTDAIEIALQSLGVGSGDEVIIPAFSFVATMEAVVNVGAVPVLCDIDPDRYCIDVKKAEKLISKKTKAVIPVHLFGQMAEMDSLKALCRRHQLWMIEDAAQAHKAEYKGLLAGSIGHFGTFSFYPGKNLGAYGDAGAITTNNQRLWQKASMIADHGRSDKYAHEIKGRNSRLDSLQAAVLRVKVKHLEEWIKSRRELAARYSEALKDIDGITLPASFAESQSVFHLYVIRVMHKQRDSLRQHLLEAGIETGIHYPVALSKLGVTRKVLKIKSSCPEAEKAASEVLSLPLYPELKSSQLKFVVKQIRKFFSDNRDSAHDADQKPDGNKSSKKKG